MLIIGVDGGASKVVAHEILVDENGLFQTGNRFSGRQYADFPGFDAAFRPVPLATQLAEMAHDLELNTDEIEQSNAYLSAFAEAIKELALQKGNKMILVGMGMPGLKSADKRGIVALANGPRMPRFCDLLEERLRIEGVRLIRPVHKLGSDADYCGIGEEYAWNGCFRNISNAYYLGGGTGVADALKIGGELLPFDEAKPWIAKTWEFKSKDGFSLEKYISARGMQLLFSDKTGISTEELDQKGVFGLQILEKAFLGDPFARETVEMVCHQLAAVLFERLSTLFFGWQHPFEFINPAKTLEPGHPYLGTLLERIILGQRLGEWLGHEAGSKMLLEPLKEKLTSFILEIKDPAFRDHYLPGGLLKQDLIILSSLRAAPALGAGADAFLNYKKNNLC